MEYMELLMQNLYGFVAAMMGALVGGIFTLRATDKAIREERAKEIRREEKEVQNMLDAIGVEIGTLWTFHMNRIGAIVENLPADGALEFYYPLTQDYFTVYNTNAAKIGQVKDAVLREAIVVCYNKCKKIVDGFKYNNELYVDYRNTAVQAAVTSMPEALVRAKRQALVDYGQMAKADHMECKGYVERMLMLLENRNQA